MAAPLGLSIAYVTHRDEPRFDWFADSLAMQLERLRDDLEVEVIFVDGLHSAARTERLRELIGVRFAFRHVPPKPCQYNGAFRLTTRDLFAAASVRNTAVLYARQPYVALVDDACVLAPTWLEAACWGARRGCVLTGAYEKRWAMVVEDGILVSAARHRSGQDVRWNLAPDGRPTRVYGGHLFTPSCGFPRALLLEVNGFDELCDPSGLEDCQLGLRLEWAGAEIYYHRGLLTTESEELHHFQSSPAGVGKSLHPDAYMEMLRRFGVSARFTPGNYDIGHAVLDILYGTRAIRSVGNCFDLAHLTESRLPSVVERFPRYHWFDLQPLEEM
jgi:hypothetical protein